MTISKELFQKILIGILAPIALSVLGYCGNYMWGVLELPKKYDNLKMQHSSDSLEIMRIKRDFEVFKVKSDSLIKLHQKWADDDYKDIQAIKTYLNLQ